MSQAQQAIEIHFTVPSYENYPVIYITGSEISLGSNNLQQLKPMVYDNHAWHAYAMVTKKVVYYHYLSLKEQIFFQRFAFARQNLVVIDEENPPGDPFARCAPLSILMTRGRQIVNNQPPYQRYSIVVFVPFLPNDAQAVVHAEKTEKPWDSHIYMNYIGNKTFFTQFDDSIGEFKICLLYNNGSIEWEGQYNRKIDGTSSNYQYNAIFSHTRRFHLHFYGANCRKISNMDALREYIQNLDQKIQVVIIDPFDEGSNIGINFPESSLEIPPIKLILNELDEFFSNEQFESVIISISCYKYLKSVNQVDQISAAPYSSYAQHRQKLLFSLFWNRLRELDDASYFKLLTYAYVEMEYLRQLMEVKRELAEYGKIIAICMKNEGELDEYISAFEFDKIKYYQEFASIGIRDGNIDCSEEFIEVEMNNNTIEIGDQFEIVFDQ